MSLNAFPLGDRLRLLELPLQLLDSALDGKNARTVAGLVTRLVPQLCESEFVFAARVIDPALQEREHHRIQRMVAAITPVLRVAVGLSFLFPGTTFLFVLGKVFIT